VAQTELCQSLVLNAVSTDHAVPSKGARLVIEDVFYQKANPACLSSLLLFCIVKEDEPGSYPHQTWNMYNIKDNYDSI
jgi:hypothetical protein